MKIDGVEIDPSELSNEFRRLMNSQVDRPEPLHLPEAEVKQLAIENVINKWLILREARKRFPTVKSDEVRARAKQLQQQYGAQFDPAKYQAEMQDDVRVDRLVGEISAAVPAVSEEDAKAVFDEDPGAFAEPERVHVSHIVRHTFGGANPGKALQQIMEAQQLLKTGQPFEAVSRQFSDEYGQAGDLGTFARGSMVDKFENVVFRMKSGEMSDVFQTEFGYHIALVHEKHPARERSFDEAKADVSAAVRESRERAAFDAFVMDLREAATIERDEPAGEAPEGAPDADAPGAGARPTDAPDHPDAPQ
ncbi:MAG TPA: peptidylprolyl isomerase [Spirochaetia bacterium]|nr:peptidylprolyl isomerase [Spirochaetia bacterium]